MTFSITHVDGTMEQPGNQPDFSERLDELVHADLEHGDVAVEHESGWALLVLGSGRVIWENVENLDRPPRHLDGLAHSEILQLMELVAAGELESVESRAWASGYEP